MTALGTGVARRWNRLAGNLLEPEGAVDSDAHIPRSAQVGKWLKVGWTSFDNEYPDRATGDPPNH